MVDAVFIAGFGRSFDRGELVLLLQKAVHRYRTATARSHTSTEGVGLSLRCARSGRRVLGVDRRARGVVVEAGAGQRRQVTLPAPGALRRPPVGTEAAAAGQA